MEDSSISRFFNRQLEVWTDARHRFRDLKHVETRQFSDQLKLQWNPARIVSTGAKIDKKPWASALVSFATRTVLRNRCRSR